MQNQPVAYSQQGVKASDIDAKAGSAFYLASRPQHGSLRDPNDGTLKASYNLRLMHSDLTHGLHERGLWHTRVYKRFISILG